MSNNMEWMAQWHATKPLTDKWMAVGEVQHVTTHTLILIVDGKAVWNINGYREHVSFGDLIAAEADSVIEVVDEGHRDLSGWVIQFNTFALVPDQKDIARYEWKLPSGRFYHKVRLSGGSLASISPYLYEAPSEDGDSSQVNRQFLVYELLKNVYLIDTLDKQSIDKGIDRTLAFMHENYGQTITREQLARIAGSSPWHYSRKFNERYGQSPLDYLAHYRIYRAQEELLLTSEKSQNIARNVGFEDPHYFSRRFKQLTGVSPRSYVQTLIQRKIVCLSPLCADILIDLGVIPHTVVVTPVLLSSQLKEKFMNHGVNMFEISQYQVHVEPIRQLKPELIIGSLWTEEIRQKLRTVAPLLSGLSTDTELLLQQLGALFHKQEEAHALKRQMEEEVEVAREQLRFMADQRMTVMVLRVEPFGYRYLGMYSNGASRMLYQQLELPIPELLKTGEAWFNPCSVDLLFKVDPDVLFVEKRVMQHFSAEENMEKLMDHRAWNALKAVQNNRVFQVDTCLWVDDRGIGGQKRILAQIVDNLMGGVVDAAQ